MYFAHQMEAHGRHALFCEVKIQVGVLDWGCLVKECAVRTNLSRLPEVGLVAG